MDAPRPERTCRRGAALLVPLAVGVLLSAGCRDNGTSGDYSSYEALTPKTAQSPTTPSAPTIPDREPASDPSPSTGVETTAPVAAKSLPLVRTAETDPVSPVPPSGPDPSATPVAAADVPLEPEFAPAEVPADSTGLVRPVSATAVPIGTDPPVRSAPGAPVVANDAPPAPREIKLLVPEREFQAEGPREAVRVSFDDFDLLKVLNMEPVPVDAADHMPDWLKGLDGRVVRVRGFMYPSFEETGIEQFLLARDNQICCFGRDPKIYDLVHVRMKSGVTTRYIANRPFDVVGVFRIKPAALDGRLAALYKIEEGTVIEK